MIKYVGVMMDYLIFKVVYMLKLIILKNKQNLKYSILLDLDLLSKMQVLHQELET